MNDEEWYETSDGQVVSLSKMIRLEPEWAASRIRVGEAAALRELDRTTRLRAYQSELVERAASLRTSHVAEVQKIADELAELLKEDDAILR